MTDRILDFADEGACLSTENGLLVVIREGKARETVPLEDIAAVVASNRQVVFTQSLLAAMAQAGAILVCSDARHHPVSMLMPLEGHSSQTERFLAQAAAPAALYGEDAGLKPLAARVRSGDAGNAESVAAQRYWPRLFADPKFRRGNDADGRNGMLNYGYAIVRAVAARAVCGAGLHPSLGVSHHNRSNAFCLADDLMEPLRPLVDRSVVLLCRDLPSGQWEVNKTFKQWILAYLTGRFLVAGERRTLFDAMARRAARLAAVFTRQEKDFVWEEIEPAS